MSFYGDNSRWFIGEVKSISDKIGVSIPCNAITNFNTIYRS